MRLFEVARGPREDVLAWATRSFVKLERAFQGAQLEVNEIMYRLFCSRTRPAADIEEM